MRSQPVDQVNNESEPLTITGQRGNAVLVGEAAGHSKHGNSGRAGNWSWWKSLAGQRANAANSAARS